MRSNQGQILVELIIAITVIIFVSVSVAFAVATSVRGTRAALSDTAAFFLSQEIIEALQAFTLEDWHNLDQLATSSNNVYFATTSAGKWTHATGSENVALNNITYTRRFWTDEVFRSTSTGNIISSGGAWDPATKKVSTKITWTAEGDTDEFTQIAFISRYSNAVYVQTDWSGGSVGEQVVTAATTTFTTSTNVNYASSAGSLKLGEI